MLANERINDQRLWINPFSGTLLIHCNIVYIFVHCMLDDGCSSVRLVRFIPYKLFMNLSLYMGKILHSICMSKWALVLGVEELRTKICHSHMHNHKHKHTSSKTARVAHTLSFTSFGIQVLSFFMSLELYTEHNNEWIQQ